MYSAFAEITEYVKANGIGKYTVADIALVEGNGGSTGYYGGWGIIVVYENSKMKWREMSLFLMVMPMYKETQLQVLNPYFRI